MSKFQFIFLFGTALAYSVFGCALLLRGLFVQLCCALEGRQQTAVAERSWNQRAWTRAVWRERVVPEIHRIARPVRPAHIGR